LADSFLNFCYHTNFIQWTLDTKSRKNSVGSQLITFEHGQDYLVAG